MPAPQILLVLVFEFSIARTRRTTRTQLLVVF